MEIPLKLRTRVAGAVAAAASGGLLFIASSLPPADAGHGTHEQLGLPACGWVTAFDRPCPTCGMTTSFALAADARPLAAFATQPAGAALALFTAVVFAGGVHVAASGASIGPLVRLLRRPATLWLSLVSILAAWIYKMLSW